MKYPIGQCSKNADNTDNVNDLDDRISTLTHYFHLDSVLLCMFECSTPRLTTYLPEESKAILTSHHASVQYKVAIRTTFVEPFDPIIGAQYIVLGEIEKSDGMSVLFSLGILFVHVYCVM